MLFTRIYQIRMSVAEALAVSATGILTVILILAIIAGLIMLVSKSIQKFETESCKASDNEQPAKASSSFNGAQGEIELIDTDEKTAAVIMAIVSKKSGIPLNRLSFRSIRLLGDGTKGEENG